LAKFEETIWPKSMVRTQFVDVLDEALGELILKRYQEM